MPQNEHIKLSIKRHGYRWDKEERERKKEARKFKKVALKARTVKGLKAKIFNRQRRVEKIETKKTIRAHEQKIVKGKKKDTESKEAVPAYLMERDQPARSKALSNMIKQKRKEKAGKWSVPIPKVRSVGEDEVFRVIQSGKRKRRHFFIFSTSYTKKSNCHSSNRTLSILEH
ncbi:Ribosome biogenesis protein NSA2 [Thelohanellus kitauei]|uniref:Ribosome biogenesis protein NSA2 n=1 Tax=Thelohanellus kitauei TaxID=669202 RepID=A0A0C2NCQ9_THEKT|nr:Ribosome biogenesis protein NSA2 [Thelohanellus kitauei]